MHGHVDNHVGCGVRSEPPPAQTHRRIFTHCTTWQWKLCASMAITCATNLPTTRCHHLRNNASLSSIEVRAALEAVDGHACPYVQHSEGENGGLSTCSHTHSLWSVGWKAQKRGETWNFNLQTWNLVLAIERLRTEYEKSRRTYPDQTPQQLLTSRLIRSLLICSWLTDFTKKLKFASCMHLQTSLTFHLTRASCLVGLSLARVHVCLLSEPRAASHACFKLLLDNRHRLVNRERLWWSGSER
jgi:hypothetical protein